MTVVVIWYRERLQQLWCAADTRISAGNATLTDRGPKILPVPVICHVQQGRTPRWTASRRQSLGFAFAGSSLAAQATHALASACTQSLAWRGGNDRPVTVEAVAQLYCKVAEEQVSQLAVRARPEDAHNYFFDGAIFGYCIARRRYASYVFVSSMASGRFAMNFAELVLAPGRYHPFGSGADGFVALDQELARTHDDPGVMTTLREMVIREVDRTVGGHFQIGISTRSGFELSPVLNAAPGPNQAQVTFLGWDVSQAPDLEGYGIGCMSTRIDY